MKVLKNVSSQAIEDLEKKFNYEFVECIEGVLLDNLILYKKRRYGVRF